MAVALEQLRHQGLDISIVLDDQNAGAQFSGRRGFADETGSGGKVAGGLADRDQK